METSIEFTSINEVMKRIKIGRTKLWQLEKDDPTFPKLVRLTDRRKVFVKAEIDAWIRSKVAQRDEVAA